jgi:hypothetical protein
VTQEEKEEKINRMSPTDIRYIIFIKNILIKIALMTLGDGGVFCGVIIFTTDTKLIV